MVGLSGRCGLINFVRGYTNPNLIFGFGNGKKGNGVLVGPTGRGASGQGKEGTPGTMEKKSQLSGFHQADGLFGGGSIP